MISSRIFHYFTNLKNLHKKLTEKINWKPLFVRLDLIWLEVVQRSHHISEINLQHLANNWPICGSLSAVAPACLNEDL